MQKKFSVKQYVLLKDLPDLKAGAIFEHREWDSAHPDRGNPGSGAMVLAWINGGCQFGWCGDSYIMPGQLAENKEWFKEVKPFVWDDALVAEFGLSVSLAHLASRNTNHFVFPSIESFKRKKQYENNGQ
jgi:hypothetical protein